MRSRTTWRTRRARRRSSPTSSSWCAQPRPSARRSLRRGCAVRRRWTTSGGAKIFRSSAARCFPQDGADEEPAHAAAPRRARPQRSRSCSNRSSDQPRRGRCQRYRLVARDADHRPADDAGRLREQSVKLAFNGSIQFYRSTAGTQWSRSAQHIESHRYGRLRDQRRAVRQDGHVRSAALLLVAVRVRYMTNRRHTYGLTIRAARASSTCSAWRRTAKPRSFVTASSCSPVRSSTRRAKAPSPRPRCARPPTSAPPSRWSSTT